MYTIHYTVWINRTFNSIPTQSRKEKGRMMKVLSLKEVKYNRWWREHSYDSIPIMLEKIRESPEYETIADSFLDLKIEEIITYLEKKNGD